MRALPWRLILREPALHFAALGLLLFGLHRAVAPVEEVPLQVDAARASAAGEGLRARLGREPTEAELAAFLRQALEEERLYREAQRLGLGRDDPIVRRRLIQKLRMIYEASADDAGIDDAALRAARDADPGRYAAPARVTLTQVLAARDRHADPAAHAAELARQLALGAAPEGLGDPSPHARRLGPRPPADFADLFGAEFAAALEDMPQGTWSVVPSALGAHAVRIEARALPAPVALDAIRGRLRADVADVRRSEALAEALAGLRRRDPASFVDVDPALAAAIEGGGAR